MATAALSMLVAACGGSQGAHTLGGTLSGLGPGTTITLQNANGATVTLSSNGAFRFPQTLPDGGSYAVTVATPPTGQTCTVTGGTGTGVVADVEAVRVLCTASTFSLPVAVSGLAPGAVLVLLNNGTDMLAVSGNGSAVFSAPVTWGGDFSVAVASQPAGQTCTVAPGQGHQLTEAPPPQAVVCTTNAYAIAGTVSDLPAGASLVLQNTDTGDSLTLNANGPFTLPTRVPQGDAYALALTTNGALACGLATPPQGVATADVQADIQCMSRVGFANYKNWMPVDGAYRTWDQMNSICTSTGQRLPTANELQILYVLTIANSYPQVNSYLTGQLWGSDALPDGSHAFVDFSSTSNVTTAVGSPSSVAGAICVKP